jgi:hypothetical protein
MVGMKTGRDQVGTGPGRRQHLRRDSAILRESFEGGGPKQRVQNDVSAEISGRTAADQEHRLAVLFNDRSRFNFVREFTVLQLGEDRFSQ